MTGKPIPESLSISILFFYFIAFQMKLWGKIDTRQGILGYNFRVKYYLV